MRAELGGADDITVHLREDRRHIQDRDVEAAAASRQDPPEPRDGGHRARWSTIALRVQPDHVTLVPERREELTTEGGLDVAGSRRRGAQAVVERCARRGIAVSLFIDPDLDQIRAVAEVGAGPIEIHTGRYAEARRDDQPRRGREGGRRRARRRQARAAGAAGHGLDYRNVRRIVAIPEIEELNIGHAIVARAALVGMDAAVREMKALLDR